ncbi:tyrosine-type recombinase/integrase [Streptomyces tubercidicus]|uniref:tyrosine-type recombinase/integrase n=1 Tax=Streptomyces tubercidicus TaxID=47759 RepID=UPI00369634B2
MTAQVIDIFTRRPVEPALMAVPELVLPQTPPPRLTAHELVDAYLRTHHGTTRDDYARDLAHFRRWLATDSGLGIDLYGVKTPHVGDWKAFSLDTMEWAPSTVRRRMTACEGLYKYASAEGIFGRNPFHGIKKPEVGSNIQYTGLSLTDVQQLGQYITYEADLQTRVAVSILMTTGLRVSEFCKALLERMRRQTGQVWLTVTRKGGKLDKVEIPQNTFSALCTYLDGRSSGPLVLGTRAGRALARQVAWRIVRSAGDSALPHLAGKLHPHDLRHTFVSGVLLLSGDIKEAQWRAGHGDINHTIRYSHALQAMESKTASDLEKVFGLCS